MKFIVVINLPDNVEKTQAIYKCFEETAKQKNIETFINVEGLDDKESLINKELVEEAFAVVVVSDTEYENDLFKEKSFIQVSSDEAIEDTEKIFEMIVDSEIPELEEKVEDIEEVEEADELIETQEFEQIEIAEEESLDKIEPVKMIIDEEGDKVDNQPKTIYRHLSSGVTAIIPIIIAGGLLTILSYCFGFDTRFDSGFRGSIVSLAATVMGLIVPILSAFIAFSISDRAGFITGLVAGVFAFSMGAGFLGGIIAGFLAGYIVKWLITLLKFPKSWDNFKLIILVPLLAIFIVGILMIYVADPIIGALYDNIYSWIKNLSQGNIVLFGAIIGLFVAFDIGGPFSKATLASTIALVGSGLFVPQAAAIAAAMVPPLGLALATVIAKDKFNDEEKETGRATWLLGLSALTEGAIPFAAADPIRVIPSIMIGSALTGAVAAAFGSGISVAKGGIFALSVTGAVTGFAGIIFAIIVGMVVTAYLIKYFKN